MSGRSIEELREELNRLMLEQIESLKKQTFVVLTQEELRQQEELLKRIREVSADLIAALKRNWSQAPGDTFSHLVAGLTQVQTLGGQNQILKGELMSEKPSVTLPGKVEKIIDSSRSSEPEKAQIAIEGADDLYREIRIENSLTDENGDTVRLK
jgi:hypothetical protein